MLTAPTPLSRTMVRLSFITIFIYLSIVYIIKCHFADKIPSIGLDEKKPYPFPHDVPRSAAMEDGCWEIKWGHRDDAVSALMVRQFVTLYRRF